MIKESIEKTQDTCEDLKKARGAPNWGEMMLEGFP